MKIIALPDLHEGGVKLLDRIAAPLMEADVVLLPGDMTNHTSSIAHILKSVRQYNQVIFAIVGNWDNQYTDTYLTQQGINLHQRHVILDGVAFLGVGGALPFLFKGSYNTLTENQFADSLQAASAGLASTLPKILVTHEPPKGVLDMHISMGSKSIRTFIEQTQPLICFCGHIHEAIGIDSIGSTKIINPGPILQGHYAYAEIVNSDVKELDIRAL